MAKAQSAPASFEHVRAFLNTWSIPNDTRVETECLISAAALRDFVQEHFPGRRPEIKVEVARQLREALRGALGQPAIAKVLEPWFEKFPVRAKLRQSDDLVVVSYEATEPGLGGSLLAAVVEAVAKGWWMRLKACPDCKWVFFDNSKNVSKVWCGMLALGPQGRACGSIAKVRRWRARRL